MEEKICQDPFDSVIKKEEEIYTSSNFRFIMNWERREVMLVDGETPGVFLVKFEQIKELNDAIWEIKFMAERGV